MIQEIAVFSIVGVAAWNVWRTLRASMGSGSCGGGGCGKCASNKSAQNGSELVQIQMNLKPPPMK